MRSRALWALAALRCAACWLAPAPDMAGRLLSGPPVQNQFSTSVVIKTLLDGQPMPSSVGGVSSNLTHWVFDTPSARSVQSLKSKSQYAPAAYAGQPTEWFNMSNWNLNGSVLLVLNQACLQYPAMDSPFRNPFDWARYATDGGRCQQSSAEGCVRWMFNATSGGYQLSNALETEADGTPLYMYTAARCVRPGSCSTYFRFNYSQSYSFGKDFRWQVDKASWPKLNLTSCSNPASCPASPGCITDADCPGSYCMNGPGKPAPYSCHGGGLPRSPINVSMYIFHPAHNFNISGQDLGDVTGDTFFMCEDLLQGRPASQDHGYGWVTQWTVQILPVWGQYQNCNGYPPLCVGANNLLVGREAALNLGYPDAGQCTANTETGSWYSLPAEGKCPEGVVPSVGLCSWRILERVKTVDSLCMIETHQMRAKCAEGRRAPFAAARAVFEAAFASENNATGGCPAIS